MNTTPHVHPQNGIDGDDQSPVYSTTYDWTSDVPLSTEVLTLVAEAADVDPIDLEPMNNCVDPDALNKLFSTREDGTPRAGGNVSFEIHGHYVTVFADGQIVVRGR